MDSPAAVRRRRRRRVADENRKRSARACDRCKARKSKCVESVAGRCQRCSVGNLDCRFEKERSPGLPDIVQTSPYSVPGPVVMPSTVRVTPRDDASVNTHSELLSPSSALSQGLAKHVIADHSKRVPWPNILSRLREAFSLDPQAAPEERDMVAMQARMICPKALHPSELSGLQQVINAFPPRSVADFLFSVFTRHATDTFFYFDQAQFMAELDQFYSDTSSPLRSDSGFVCLAMATFALASQWTPMERPEGSDTGEQPGNVDLGRVFYRHARTLIPDIIDRPCLRSIQAPFILGVYLLPASAVGSSYVYMGLALRKALASDLHLHSDDQGIDEREMEVRRRLWWSIYSLERCTTAKLNRPRSVSIDIITVSPPAPYPPLDRSQIFNNIDCQIAYTRLVKILDQIADIGEDSMNLSRYAKWETSLKEWKQSLPSDFKLDQIDPKSSKYRTVLHLRLNYHYAWITMGKVALVTVARTHLRHHLQPESQTPNLSDLVRKLAKACTKAARKILQLFEILRRTQKITRFSFTDFQGCSIATIVTLVAGIIERDSGYDSRVAFGLDCLTKMATGNMTAKMGVRFVQAVQSITTEAAEKISQATSLQLPQHNAESAVSSGYNQWSEWLTLQERLTGNTAAARPVAFEYLQAAIGGRSSCQPSEEQLYSSSSYIPRTPTESPAPPVISDTGDNYPFSALYVDEQTLLMGLTGLDALDFSGLTDQL